ncbi:MAG: Integrase core domain protein [Bacteroidetes bacterium ADurb.Bin028]|nr:MAG: Integrase core domain protein [Bacteroidetes bacterium ADurb.Bin028]
MVVRAMRGRYKLEMLLEIANLSRQTYEYNDKHLNDQDQKDKAIETEILAIFTENYQKYGIPRITQELKNRGYPINHKRVERLMKKLNIQARPKQRKYRSYRGEVGRIADNLVAQDFTTSTFYEKLGTDVTVFIGKFGKVYLSPIIDFHNREILAYDTSISPDYRQINRMFKELKLLHNGKLNNTIIHSDQGWQYQMQKYREKLAELQMVQSMSRKGNCLDNSPTENFFGRMKEEMFYGKEHLYNNEEELMRAIDEYIDYYNTTRIVVKLKMSPKQFKNLQQDTLLSI